MTIKLRPAQHEWLKERDDLTWAKPDVDEARAAAARGEVVSLEDALADIDVHLAALKR
jgi:hypothetical protein